MFYLHDNCVSICPLHIHPWMFVRVKNLNKVAPAQGGVLAEFGFPDDRDVAVGVVFFHFWQIKNDLYGFSYKSQVLNVGPAGIEPATV